MNRFASLFPSAEHAEQAYSALTGRMGDYIDARIVGMDDWKANWGLEEKFSGDRKKRRAQAHGPEFYLDLWLTEDAVRYFTDGLKQGGAVLVVTVPESLSHQAEKLVKENHGKVM